MFFAHFSYDVMKSESKCVKIIFYQRVLLLF